MAKWAYSYVVRLDNVAYISSSHLPLIFYSSLQTDGTIAPANSARAITPGGELSTCFLLLRLRPSALNISITSAGASTLAIRSQSPSRDAEKDRTKKTPVSHRFSTSTFASRKIRPLSSRQRRISHTVLSFAHLWQSAWRRPPTLYC